MKKVIILTEGGENIGFGHITRCTSLYQAFEEKGIIPEFIVYGDDSILNLLSDKNHKIFNWIEQKKHLFDFIKNADIVIIDSYLAEKDIYDRISDIVKVPVYLDDNKRINYPNGIVINGSIYAEELDYPQNNGITYLLGTQYTLLRKEFWEVPEKEIKEEIESVMVTFGGDDIRNITPKIMCFLKQDFPELIKNVVIGKGFKNVREIEELKDDKINIIYYPDAEDMKNIMLESDIAISAAGQTTYELARVGIPTTALILVENQVNNIIGFEEAKFIINAGWWNSLNIQNNIIFSLNQIKDRNIRIEKSNNGKSNINGQGSLNIVDLLVNNTFLGE